MRQIVFFLKKKKTFCIYSTFYNENLKNKIFTPCSYFFPPVNLVVLITKMKLLIASHFFLPSHFQFDKQYFDGTPIQKRLIAHDHVDDDYQFCTCLTKRLDDVVVLCREQCFEKNCSKKNLDAITFFCRSTKDCACMHSAT